MSTAASSSAQESEMELSKGGKRMRKIHRCPYSECDKEYDGSTNLKIHIRSVHTKERPFTCSICQKAFSARGNQVKHEKRVHKTFPGQTLSLRRVSKVSSKTNKSLQMLLIKSDTPRVRSELMRKQISSLSSLQ